MSAPASRPARSRPPHTRRAAAHLTHAELTTPGVMSCLAGLPDGTRYEAVRKLVMLHEGECGGLGPTRAAAKYGYTRQGYHRLRAQFHRRGFPALLHQTGPKTNYRRNPEVVRLVLQIRKEEPGVQAEDLLGRLHAAGHQISLRSVQRILSDHGLQRWTRAS